MVKISATQYERDVVVSYLPAGYPVTETQTLSIYYPEGQAPEDGWPYHIHWYFGGFANLNLFSNTTIGKALGLPFELLELGIAVVVPGCTGSNLSPGVPNPITGGGFFRPTDNALWTNVNNSWYHKDAVLASSFLSLNASTYSLAEGTSRRTAFGRSAGGTVVQVNGLAPEYPGFGHDSDHRVAGFICQSGPWYWKSWTQNTNWTIPPFSQSGVVPATQVTQLQQAVSGYQEAASPAVYGFESPEIRALNAGVKALYYHPGSLESTNLTFTGSLAGGDYLPPEEVIPTSEPHPGIAGVYAKKQITENGGSARLLLGNSPYQELLASGADTNSLVDLVVPDKDEEIGPEFESADDVVLKEQIKFVLGTIGSGYTGAANNIRRIFMLFDEDEFTDLIV